MKSNEKLYKSNEKYFLINLLNIDGLTLELVDEYSFLIIFIYNNDINNTNLSYIKLDYNSVTNISVKRLF